MVVGKATINVVAPKASLSHNSLLLVPIPLLISGVRIGLSLPACKLSLYFRPRDACYPRELFLINVGPSACVYV